MRIRPNQDHMTSTGLQAIQFRPVSGRNSHKNRVSQLKKSVFQPSEVVLSAPDPKGGDTERVLVFDYMRDRLAKRSSGIEASDGIS